MGQRGPQPTPATVHHLRGNPSKLPLTRLLDGSVQPVVRIPPCPSHLLPAAKAEWKRLAPQLEQLGLISDLDRAFFAAYCQSYARWVAAELRIKQLNGEDALEPCGCGNGAMHTGAPCPKPGRAAHEAGLVGVTPSGYKQISVQLQISNRALEQMEKFGSHFGFSPSQRSRVTSSEARQGQLPGIPDKPSEPEPGFAGFK